MAVAVPAGSHAIVAGWRPGRGGGATEAPQKLASVKVCERFLFVESGQGRVALSLGGSDGRRRRLGHERRLIAPEATEPKPFFLRVSGRAEAGGFPLLCVNHNERCQVQICNCKRDSQETTTTDEVSTISEDPWGVKAALALLSFYKREISPLLPGSCRYVPTCSEYSMTAFRKYGVFKGTVLTACRLARCNPLGGSGFDPPRWFGEPPPPS